MIDELLKVIRDEAAEFDEQLPGPATQQQVDELRTRARKELGIELPEGYVKFLLRHNGIHWDGMSVYGTEPRRIRDEDSEYNLGGLIEENVNRGLNRPYITFADNGDEEFVFDKNTGKYLCLDAIGLGQNEIYRSFDSMIKDAFENHT